MFIFHEFIEFMIQNGITHIRVVPYHPASNGAAERAVRLFKESLTKQVLENNSERSLKHRIADFLLRYRSTPHGTIGLSPAELLMKRQLRIRLNLVKPDLTKVVNKKQKFQKVQFDKTRKDERMFNVGFVVKVKNTRAQSKTDKWLFRSIIDVKGPRNYVVKIGSERKLVHADHVVKVVVEASISDSQELIIFLPVSDPKNSLSTTANDSLVDNTEISVNSEQNSLFIDQDVDNVNNGNDTNEPDQILAKKKTSKDIN